ncbi:MAG: DUF5813 family protein [Haloferacaceae archaeon]
MTDIPDRVRRAFRDHDGFEPAPDPGTFAATTTPFRAEASAAERSDGAIGFEVVVRAPTLSVAAEDRVAAVVEEGWYETFELRVSDAGSVTRADREIEPAVRRAGDEVVVETSYADLDPRRGVADAMALVNFVEGTYVQGVIPGYEYGEPVAGLLAEARRAAGAED